MAYFVAEDDRFLDVVADALDQLVSDCKTALRWSHDDTDADAVLQATEQSLCSIVSICKNAGLTIDSTQDHYVAALGHIHSSSDNLTSSYSSFNPILNSTPPWPNSQGNKAKYEEIVHPPPCPVEREQLLEQSGEAIRMSPTEEIVEVELTDLLTQSHEEMMNLQQRFDNRMTEAEQANREYKSKHAQDMQALQEEVASSRAAMDRIKQELLESTSRKLEDMHSAINSSQRAIEASMKDQALYWKSICEELVVEKRDMAHKVAEVRGRYTALKAHLTSHDDMNSRAGLHSRGRIREDESVSKLDLCELSPSSEHELSSENQASMEKSVVYISTCSTPTDPSSGLVVVPSADSVSGSCSAEGSPTHSNSSSSSSKTGKTTFRRYYLAQKRENRVVLH
ncbi:hypothetical protein P3T76_008784 [Phytophthora citrophthora]|uniref:Uncharacterized protein n=1 Tax=Phytophthora citrophthora TaxID=4793 RepID=A0AAD9GIW3_9STRA|nr:hypothetical protein P3T76_008784 [Phytophthora citrophthora]